MHTAVNNAQAYYDMQCTIISTEEVIMDKEVLDYVAERADILATAESSKQETKDAALAWKEAVAAGDDAAVEEATAKFVDFLEGRPREIDGLIAFLEGPAKEIFGEEGAAQALETQKKRKEEGAKFCDCPSCTAASEILAKFGRVEL